MWHFNNPIYFVFWWWLGSVFLEVWRGGIILQTEEQQIHTARRTWRDPSHQMYFHSETRWWFQVFWFSPLLGETIQFDWLIFFRWVETTKQKRLFWEYGRLAPIQHGLSLLHPSTCTPVISHSIGRMHIFVDGFPIGKREDFHCYVRLLEWSYFWPWYTLAIWDLCMHLNLYIYIFIYLSPIDGFIVWCPP